MSEMKMWEQIVSIKKKGFEEEDRLAEIEKQRIEKGLTWFMNHVYKNSFPSENSRDLNAVNFLYSELNIDGIDCVCVAADKYGKWFEVYPKNAGDDIGSGCGQKNVFPK